MTAVSTFSFADLPTHCCNWYVSRDVQPDVFELCVSSDEQRRAAAHFEAWRAELKQ